MLVLTREIREKIAIGDDLIIEIVQVDRGRVQLGITTPKDKVIMRQELYTPEEWARIEISAEGKR